MYDGQDNGNGTALAERPQQVPAVRREIRVVHDETALGYLLDTARYEHTQRIALGMARASLIPKHLRGQNEEQTVANCFLVVNQSLRWGMDPFAVAPETYEIGGKLAYQGKLIAAVVNARAGLDGRLRYSFDGKGDGLTITVRGRFKGETEDCTVTLSVGQARTQNQMWTKDPEQKLIYSGTIRWARRYCPEVVLGVVTEDDIDRINATNPAAPARQPSASLRERLKDTQLPEDEAAKVAESVSSQSPADPEPVTQAGNETGEAESTATPGGGDVEPFTGPLPDSARKTTTFISDAVNHFRPKDGTTHRSAMKAFAYRHRPHSWENVAAEMQDVIYDELRAGKIDWSKGK